MLSRFGRVRMVAGNDNVKEKFDWADALVDSAIIGGIAFGNALVGSLADGVLSSWDVTVSVCTAFLSFITFLGVKRKLVKAEPA